MNENDSILGFMGHDHDRLDEIFTEFKKLKQNDLDKAKQYFQEFKEGLERHIIWEEDILFPHFDKKNGFHNTGPTMVMKQEHIEIKKNLYKIQDLLDHNNIKTEDYEKQMFSILKMHNDKEESILYPAIDKISSTNQVRSFIDQMKN